MRNLEVKGTVDVLNARAAVACLEIEDRMIFTQKHNCPSSHTAGVAFWNIMLACVFLLSFSGCRGCRQSQPTTTTTKETDKKKLQRLTISDVRAMPFLTEAAETNVNPNFVKPGHWYMANSNIKANFDDESLDVALSIENREGKLANFSPLQPPVEFKRSFTLSKGQEKNIKMRFLQPEVGTTGEEDFENSFPSFISTTFTQRSLGTPITERRSPNRTLLGYQYQLVNISRDTSRYTFWRKLDCIIWPSRLRFSNERITPHIVVDLKEDEIPNQFPDRMYAMTTISHLVINDASLATLSPDQQKAIEDWLYFGGTIVVNGPDAIAGIETSFLKGLVPLERTSSSEFTADDIDRLNRGWTIPQALGPTIPMQQRAIPKLSGSLSKGSQWVQCTSPNQGENGLNGFVAERLIGQGRIVMTCFPMTDSAFLSWPSYSSLIHNVILRKPNRTVVTGNEADTRYAGSMESTEMNPIHSTRLRLWSRDLDSTMARIQNPVTNKTGTRGSGTSQSSRLSNESPSTASNFRPTKRTSLGAWNPQSMIMTNARTALQESSGITVPKLNTIVKLLIGYLIVLVPLNWLLFRLIGRLEWAWVAAPIVAAIGAIVVARGVQLDVGFSRSQTTVGFLECHAGYPRGVLSKYMALYSSLSTNYRAMFEQDQGVVLPMTATASTNRRRPLSNVSKIEYNYGGDAGSGLRSVQVMSNTTGLIQSEEVIENSGPMTAVLEADQSTCNFENESGHTLRDVGIIGMAKDGSWLSGWIGDLSNGQSTSCKLQPCSSDSLWRKEWDITPTLAAPNFLRVDDTYWTDQNLGEELYLGPMLDLVVKNYPFGRGEFIALGWCDESLGTLKITPQAKQSKERTVVMVHLSSASMPPATPDIRIFPKQSDPDEE